MTHDPALGGRVDRPPDPASVAGLEWVRRMRLERQLHDGASLRISALTLQLGLLRRHGDSPGFQDAVTAVQDELHTVLDELREVADAIYPPLLDQAGLGPALRELIVRAGLPVSVRAGDDRFGTAAEGAAYFGLADVLTTALADVPEHPHVEVVLRRARDTEKPALMISLTGVSACHAELMTYRVDALGGSVTTSVTHGTPDGDPITVRIPCE
jgi:signal transduction histidine kinase